MGRSDVFVDTSGLYALVDRNDSHHASAREVVGAASRAGRMLVLTDYIISETTTLARARSGSPMAIRVLDLVERSAAIVVERVDVARFDATKAFFRKHIDHGYSFADCSSFVLMRELRIIRALTSDRHFREAGFEPLLRTQ